MGHLKHVLHVWQSHYPWEVRVGKINRALLSEQIKVSVIARQRKNEAQEEIVDDVPIYRVGDGYPRAFSLPISGNILWSKALAAVFDRTAIDMILVRDIPLALASARIAKKKKVPVVLDMAEHYPEAMRSWKKYSDNFILKKIVHDWQIPDRVERKSVLQMDAILVVCEEQKERLVREYAYPENKICVVLNTPELEQWHGVELPALRESPFYFGYHGILCEDRELEVILRGFDLAVMHAPELRLLIAGGGESEEKLRSLAKGLSCYEKIRFTGRYQPKELTQLYNEVDFGVVSLRSNIFTQNTVANKFFDYPALGKPFIFPAIRPLERLMSKMNCAVAFEPGSPDSVAKAMHEIRKNKYSELSQNGRRAVMNTFNWKNDSRAMLDFLKRL